MNDHLINWTEAEAHRLRNKLGATYLGNGRCLFRVWAPERKSMELHLVSPADRLVPLQQDARGYWEATVENLQPGARYLYRIDSGNERPDPASRFQPEGVHQSSQVVDSQFQWSDQHWFGVPLNRHVIYELHVGTFTQEGTFDAIIPHLEHLKDLGVTAIELMPVAQFPGRRNWGYDGVYPYAVQNSYGGPDALKRLVNAAHGGGLAVVLDVVYNHLGPEGNYLGEFGPYFTDCYKTPWGSAINFDGPYSEEVRHFFANNACFWIQEYHLDGLRLDATHFIFDTSARPFLRTLAQQVKEAADCVNRRVYLFAESDTNDVRWVKPAEMGGFGVNAQWNDDFQHALITILPGADAGAYTNDYGSFRQLVKAYEEGFVFSGEYSNYRKRRHGNSSRDIHGKRLVVFVQNHDQVGNRPKGDRICTQISHEGAKLAAGSLILAPYLPLLFMGEEYGEKAPFQYFVEHGDAELIESVRKGRKEEFSHFLKDGELPDPQDEATMKRCVLNHKLRDTGEHRALWQFHRELLRLRREIRPLSDLSKENLRVYSFPNERTIVMHRRDPEDAAVVVLCFSTKPVEIALPLPEGTYTLVVDSTDKQWLGAGAHLPATVSAEATCPQVKLAPESVAVYLRTE
jgi:maltooligosyltrehalose trehalohydrolase